MFVLTLLAHSSYGQKLVEGSLIVQQSKNGAEIAKFDNNVLIESFVPDKSNWFEVNKTCYVKLSSVVNATAKRNSDIFNQEGKKIGTLLSDLKTNNDQSEKHFPGYVRVYINGYALANNIKEASYTDLRNSQKVLLEDSVQSRIIAYQEDGITHFKKTETVFGEAYDYTNNTSVNYLTKTVKNTLYDEESEGGLSMITVTFYPNYSTKNSFSYTKRADEFTVNNNILLAKTYGCCASPTELELSTFPGNKTFLQANDWYYVISIPNSKMKIYLGVSPGEPDKTLTKICELQYSINGESTQKIVFRAKSKAENEKFLEFTPDMELISVSSGDKVQKMIDYSEMEAWSLNTMDNVSAINGVGVKLTFEQEDKKKSYAIFFKNGKILTKEVVVDL